MNVKKIDHKLYKAIMMGFQYQINCEITPEQCKELVDFIDNPLVIDDEQVCEWKLTDCGIAEDEPYEPHLYIGEYQCVDGWYHGEKPYYKFCPSCGKPIKYVEEG